jgi:hypothetical protein
MNEKIEKIKRGIEAANGEVKRLRDENIILQESQIKNSKSSSGYA